MWKKEYIRLLFPPNLNDIQIEQAQELKYQNIPSSLYRYRSFTDDNIQNLKNEVEWQSYPLEFNDPYDSGMYVSFKFLNHTIENSIIILENYGVKLSSEEVKMIKESDTPIEDLSQVVLNKKFDFTEDIEEILKALDLANNTELELMEKKTKNIFRNGYLVICFSEKMNNILMWSHYAENHTGYCIEYDFKSLGPNHPRVRMLYPIIYTKNFFDATEYFKNILGTCKNKRDFNSLFGLYPTISKAKDWKYEKEWRMIFPYGPGANKRLRLLSMTKPKRIYIGALANKQNIEKIVQIANEKKIPVHQMELATDRFKLLDKVIYKPMDY